MIINKNKEILWKHTQYRRDIWERKFQYIIKSMLNSQMKTLADRIHDGNERSAALLTHIDKEPVERMMIDLYKSVGVAFARDIYRQLKGDRSLILTKSTEDDWVSYMIAYAKNEAGKRITSITETSRELARQIIDKILEQSTNEGWGSDETARELRRALVSDGIDINQWRSLRIARTEVMTASNAGSMEGARSTGATGKYWIATHDDRVRPDHLDVEGQNPVKIDESFNVGGYDMDCPGDPAGGAEEVINCRCAIAFE